MTSTIKEILKDKLLVTVTVIIPLITTILYALIYRVEIVEELPIALIDYDRSELSRQFADMLDVSASLKIVDEANSIESVKNAMISGNLEGALVIPRDFSKVLKKGKNANIVFYKNSQNIIVSNVLLKEISTISEIFSSKVFAKKLLSQNISTGEAAYIVNPIKINTHSLFNPNYSYLNYLVPGLVLFTLQFASILSGAFVTTNTGNPDWRHCIKRFTIIFALNILVNLLIMFPLLYLLNVSAFKNIIGVLMLIFIATYTLMNIGFALSLYIKDKYNVMEAIIFYTTPAFVFSGLTFPTWGMPKLNAFYSSMLPFTYYLNAFLQFGRMNSSISAAYNQLEGLLIFLILALTAIAIKYFTTSRKGAE